MRTALLPLKQQSDSGVLKTQLGAAAIVPTRKKSGMMPLVAAGGAFVVLAAGGGIWWFVSHRQPATPPPVAQVAPPPVEPAPVVTPPVETPPVDAGMTNQGVIDLVEAKVPESTILNQIRASKTNFDLTNAGIIQLTKAGVKSNIIEVMRNPKLDPTLTQKTPPRPATSASTPAPPTKPGGTSPSAVSAEPSPAPAAAQTPPPPVQPPPQPAAQSAAAVPTRIHTVSINSNLPFTIKLTQEVPLKLTAGQQLKFVVANDVKVGDAVIINKGTPLTGEVVDPGEAKRLLIVKSKATFKLSSVDSAGGTKLKIRAIAGRRSEDKADRPIELQGTKNKEVLAPAGTEYTVYTDGDQTVTLKR